MEHIEYTAIDNDNGHITTGDAHHIMARIREWTNTALATTEDDLANCAAQILAGQNTAGARHYLNVTIEARAAK